MGFSAQIKTIDNGFIVQIESYSELSKKLDVKVFFGSTLKEIYDFIDKNK